MEKKQPALPIRELITMIKDFVYPEWEAYSKEEKMKWINNYRRVENETNEQIQKAGSVENWYLSGQGRLINL